MNDLWNAHRVCFPEHATFMVGIIFQHMCILCIHSINDSVDSSSSENRGHSDAHKTMLSKYENIIKL